MTRYESPLSVALKGALAGLAGTAALTVVKQRGPALMQQIGMGQPDQATRETAATSGASEEPTAAFAEKVSLGVLDRPMDDETKQTVGQTVHWAYGAAWGVYYGIVQGSLRLPTLTHGTIFGMLVAGVASTVVPSMGLTPPPTRQPKSMLGMQTVMHLIYGWVTALTFRFLARSR